MLGAHVISFVLSCGGSNEPHGRKTCLRGFHPGLTTNQAVQKMAIGFKFWVEGVEGFYCLQVCSENKGADQLCGVTLQLICAFVFTYAESRLSHDAAQMSLLRITYKIRKHLFLCLHMNLRKPALCLGNNKYADQPF